VGAGATGTRGAPGAAPSREVGARAVGTHGALGATLSREERVGATVTRGSPRATMSREVGAGPAATCGGPRALRPSVSGQGVVVPVTPLDNPHQMITRGKTSFTVVLDRLVLTAATSSPTPALIPFSAHAALADPHWRAAMEEGYGSLISNGT
jgi:hypothetical protein